MRALCTILLLVTSVAVHAAEPPEKRLPLPGNVFTVQGRTAFVIPGKAVADGQPRPWVWYAPTLPNLPGEAERWMFERFCDAGIAIAAVTLVRGGAPRVNSMRCGTPGCFWHPRGWA